MRDAIVKSIQRTWRKVQLKELPRVVSDIEDYLLNEFADDIIKSVKLPNRERLIKIINSVIPPKEGTIWPIKAADAILAVFNNNRKIFGSIGKTVEYKKPKMLHRPCPCGSQFRLEKVEFSNKNINCRDGWFLICENLGGCCEVISVFVKAKTLDEAWLIWDQGVIRGE